MAKMDNPLAAARSASDLFDRWLSLDEVINEVSGQLALADASQLDVASDEYRRILYPHVHALLLAAGITSTSFAERAHTKWLAGKNGYIAPVGRRRRGHHSGPDPEGGTP